MQNDEENDEFSRGSSMLRIYNEMRKWSAHHCPRVSPAEDHTVLYNMPLDLNNLPPKPRKGHLKWDAYHVRLPCSTKSQYPVHCPDSLSILKPKWELVQEAFARPITSSRELEKAIFSYNTKYAKSWKFKALHKLFEEELNEYESDIFFNELLPKIIELALRLPELVPTGIPLLKQEKNMSISMSQQQISCLLANAFLCTFPRRNTFNKKSEYSLFPDINFNRLFQSSGQSVLEKIKCLCHYFRRVCTNVPTGCVTFTRRFIKNEDFPKWDRCDLKFVDTPLHITSSGTIEDQGKDLLQVDFANKYLGGGVLGHGCVQEEIRFVICPELMVTKLFTEALTSQEALLIVGCERYSNYSGYASTFQWSSNCVDETPFDDSNRRRCHIVAIDALDFSHPDEQFKESKMLRELNKAYAGFYNPSQMPAPGVASGNWGCGAFGGESQLKALLQLMVCVVTKRPLVYFTFENDTLRDNIFAMYKFLIEKEITVAQLWHILKDFKNQNLKPNELYAFVYQKYYDSQNQMNKAVPTAPAIIKKPVPQITEPKSETESESEADKIDVPTNSMDVDTSPKTDDPRKKIKMSLLDSLDASYYNSPSTEIKKHCLTTDNENNELCNEDAESLLEVVIECTQSTSSQVSAAPVSETEVVPENSSEKEEEDVIPGTPPPPESKRGLSIFQSSNASSSKSKIYDYFARLTK